MFDRTGKDAIGRAGTGSRGRSKAGERIAIESLEGRALLTASIQPIANISVPQYLGYQVPIVAGTTDNQTYTVTSDNPGVKASIAQGQFLTIGVTHASSGANDPAFSGTMTYQLFNDLTPVAASQIESLVNGTATGLASGVSIGTDYYVGKIFHRVANGFPGPTDYIVQGGSLNGDGTGQVFANPFADEFVQSLAFTGTYQLALANSGPDTNDSQFFVTTGSPRSLDFGYTIFGQLVAGQNIVNEMTQVAVGGSAGTTPTDPITITSATLSNVNPDGVVHIDTTLAPANATANVTVTATDSTDKTTASQTFQVNVTPFDTTNPEKPFLGPIDSTLNIGENQTLKFQLTAVAVPPDDQLTYTVQGGTTTSTASGSSTPTTTFTPVSNATATVSANGLVTVTPTTGYTGPIKLLVGVRDQVNRAGGSTALDSPANYEYHTITVNVASSTTPIAQRPLAQPALVTVTNLAATPIQLSASNPNATTTLPLTYAIATQPTHGTITNFNATTGSLDYTPTPGYVGPDAIQFTATDPNSNTTSFPTTVNLTVNQANTGAVRFIADDGTSSTTETGNLIITPVPRTDGGTNVISVTQANGNVNVTVNGVLDAIQPPVSNIDRLIFYGSKANDRVTIDPSLTFPVTLDGGHGGKNVLTAGDGPTREHGWFGQNVMKQGESDNYQLGHVGRVTFVPGSGTSDVIFAGIPSHPTTLDNAYRQPTPTTGTFYTFKNNKLVKTISPYTPAKTTNNTPKGPTTTTTTVTTSHGGNGNSTTERISKVTKPTTKK